MRRSTMVKLTLLPLLATAAIASLAVAEKTAVADPDNTAPPGMTDPALSPPGMTQPIMERECTDPDPARRPAGCTTGGGHFSGSGTFRGGFGHYFGTGSGG